MTEKSITISRNEFMYSGSGSEAIGCPYENENYIAN